MGLPGRLPGMVQKYKKQAFNLGVYMMASMIPLVSSVIANPFIAMNMSPTDYATVGYYTAFNTLITPFVNFYLLHYYTKRYFEMTEGERLELKSVLVRALIFFSLILAAVSLGCLLVYTVLFNAESKLPFFPYALISVMSIPLTGLFSLNLADYRMQRNSKAFFALSVSGGLLVLGLCILLVVVLKYGALGKLLSVLIGNICIFSYCLHSDIKLLKIRFNAAIFREALKFCYPLVLAAMLSFFATGYDRVVLERTGNLTDLGFYVVGVQIAGYLGVFSASIDDTFQPDIFESIVHKNYRKCAKIISVKIGLASVIVLTFIILAPFLVDILTAGRYVASTKYAIVVALSSITSMLYYSFTQVTIALGYSQITLINKIIGSVLCLGMYTVFVSRWGAIGAAWGTVLSFLIFFVGNVFLIVFKMRNKNEQS